VNIQPFDAAKHGAASLVADAREGLRQLSTGLGSWKASPTWLRTAKAAVAAWRVTSASAMHDRGDALPSDAQVIGAVQQAGLPTDIVVCAAGGLPGELQRHWIARERHGYHVEYGYSCMGYEIAGGLGVKFAHPDREVVVMVGDGSYLMMNSELETSIRLRKKLIVVLLDNGGFGCIERLQRATGNASFNNLLEDSGLRVDFVAHARSLGAHATKAANCADLSSAITAARRADRTSVIVIETDPFGSTEEGGHWWDVPIPETSSRPAVRKARRDYARARSGRSKGSLP
jgi:3D-(3,5/4)-trihydroxycyclohexane-1,2-dione acylhydrolase (decyclizing)